MATNNSTSKTPDSEHHATTDVYLDDFRGIQLKDVIPNTRAPWYRDGTLLKLNFLLLAALLTQTASGFDASMLNGMQSLPQWEKFFGHPMGKRLGAMSFGPGGGTLISVLVSSQLCDRYGRRMGIFVGSAFIIVGAILQTAANDFGMFVAGRFVIGFGLGIVATGAPPLLSELAYPTHRAQIVSFFLVSWPLGSLIAAWITFGTFKMQNSWAWRLPSLLQCFFSLIQISLVWFCPESPRWLIYQGRHREAKDVLVKWHGYGDPNSRLAQFEYAEITATLELEKIQKKARWSEYISSTGNRHRLFIALYIPAMLQLCGNALTSYFLSKVLNSIGIKDHKTQLALNGSLSVWSLITATTAALLCDRAGRRRLFLIGLIGMGFSFIVWTALSAVNQETHFKHTGYAAGVLTMIFIFSAWYHCCSPIGATYIMEVTPFSLRAKAAMLYQLTGNLAGLFNSFTNPIAMEAIEWKYYIVWCCALAIHLAVVFFMFPETKGRSLEEVSELFDGPRDVVEELEVAKKQDVTFIENATRSQAFH